MPPRARLERRVDPEDGAAYTFDELSAFYRGRFRPAEIRSYWEEVCAPAGAAAVAAGRARASGGDAPAASASSAGRAGGRGAAETKRSAANVARAMAARERDWRVGGVVYQVFVDRFAPPGAIDEARRALFPSPCVLHEWSEEPKRGDLNTEVGYWAHELQFWGGDLPGLRGKLDYLSDLGVDVLYLQPISEAFSNHKYDAIDYCKLDPQYGTPDDFKSLADGVHEKGMKLVLDGVFNHVGRRNHHVQDALSDKESQKREWFFMGDEYPLGYKTWGCADNLVELKLECRALQEYIWKGKDSVIATWLKLGADGWRLDVAQELGFEFLGAITAAAHRHLPGSLVVGEVWAYPSRWTSVMDGVLSLHLGVLIFGVVQGTCPGPSAARSVASLIAESSVEEVLRSWIVVSNHDMPRLAHRLPELAPRKLAQVLQFTLPGCPLVYYGDEIGMVGGDDPENRAPFRWEAATESNDMFVHTRMLVAMRRRLRALRIGNYRALDGHEIMAFMRTTEKVMDTVVVLVNPTDKPVKEMVVVPDARILGYTLFRDELSGEELRVHGATMCIEVAPGSARVLSMSNEAKDNPSGAQYKRIYGHWASFDGLRP